MKRLCTGLFALLLCLSFAVPALAYPAGIDTSLPRVVDNDELFSAEEIAVLEQSIARLAEEYQSDLVILTEPGIGSSSPEDYADDFFDYGGYGWREAETGDITTGNGTILLLVGMRSGSGRRMEISSKGTAEDVFDSSARERIFDNIQPLLMEGNFFSAAQRFLADAEDNLSGPPVFSVQIFIIGLLIAFAIALAVVLGMKRKLNTARPQPHASDYMKPGSFRLTQQSDTFLYSQTTKVRIDNDSHGGSGGSGGGGRISSSGSHHSGGGRSF